MLKAATWRPTASTAQLTYGRFSGSGSLLDCVVCPQNASTGNNTGNIDISDCVCRIGFSGVFPANESCSICDAGRVDNDADPATPCVDCQIGFFAPAADTLCVGCQSGQSDHDSNPGTPCRNCATGTYSDDEAIQCADCSPGQYDHDLSAASLCLACGMGKFSARPRAFGNCISCPSGRFQPSVGADSEALCYPCGIGQFAANGSATCETCVAGTFDEDSDPATPCKRCDDIEGLQCFGTVVSPAPGYYMELQVCPEQRPAGTPPLGCEYSDPACAGTPDAQDWVDPVTLNSEPHPGCEAVFTSLGRTEHVCPAGCDYTPAVLTTEEAGNLATLSKCSPSQSCIGGLYGQENCRDTYWRDRCASCKRKHYRLEGECFPCEESMPIWYLISAFIVGFIAAALAIDRFLTNVKNVSQLLAPALILLTFFQTLAILLQVSLSWPPQLRQLMTYFSFINLNIELARPECSIQWDAASKITMILWSPVAFMGLIGLYGMSKVVFHKKNEATGSHEIRIKMESMAIGFFIVASSFFLKGILGGIDCTLNSNGKWYLDMQPDIECDVEYLDADGRRIYEVIRDKAYIGMGLYALIFLGFLRFFLSDEGKHRFAFLTAKMEDEWYWWEVFLLLRKVLIMCSGTFNTSAPERGWYLGSTVIIFSLTCHAYARPFKDPLVDTCEFASLLSTLVIFQGGMVWNIDTTGSLSALLEAMSITLILIVTGLGAVVQYQAFGGRADDPDQFTGAQLRMKSNKALLSLCTQLGIDVSAVVEREQDLTSSGATETASSQKYRDEQLQTQMTERTQQLIDKLESLPATACVNRFCTFWSGAAGEEFIDELNGINKSAEELLLLLWYERAHANRKGVIKELQRRWYVAEILKNDYVRRLMANIRIARSDAIAAADLLEGEAELDAAILVLMDAQAVEISLDVTNIKEKLTTIGRKTFNSGRSGLENGVRGVNRVKGGLKSLKPKPKQSVDMVEGNGDAAVKEPSNEDQEEQQMDNPLAVSRADADQEEQQMDDPLAVSRAPSATSDVADGSPLPDAEGLALSERVLGGTDREETLQPWEAGEAAEPETEQEPEPQPEPGSAASGLTPDQMARKTALRARLREELDTVLQPDTTFDTMAAARLNMTSLIEQYMFNRIRFPDEEESRALSREKDVFIRDDQSNKYRALMPLTIRARADPQVKLMDLHKSAKAKKSKEPVEDIGVVEPGEIISALEVIKERKKPYVRVRFDRGWVTAVTKSGVVQLEKVIPEEDVEERGSTKLQKLRRRSTKRKADETQAAPEEQSSNKAEPAAKPDPTRIVVPADDHPAHPAFDDGNLETARAVASALASYLNTEPDAYKIGDKEPDPNQGWSIGFGGMYAALMTDPETRRQHRYDAAIEVFSKKLFHLSHADESQPATRATQVMLAYSDNDRHLEELDEAMGLFGF